MISFIGAPYEVSEIYEVARVSVGVERKLMREVIIELTFLDGSAISKFYCKYTAAIHVTVHGPAPAFSRRKIACTYKWKDDWSAEANCCHMTMVIMKHVWSE